MYQSEVQHTKKTPGMQVIVHAIAKKLAHMEKMHGVFSECISLRRFAKVHKFCKDVVL